MNRHGCLYSILTDSKICRSRWNLIDCKASSLYLFLYLYCWYYSSVERRVQAWPSTEGKSSRHYHHYPAPLWWVSSSYCATNPRKRCTGSSRRLSALLGNLGRDKGVGIRNIFLIDDIFALERALTIEIVVVSIFLVCVILALIEFTFPVIFPGPTVTTKIALCVQFHQLAIVVAIVGTRCF